MRRAAFIVAYAVVGSIVGNFVFWAVLFLYPLTVYMTFGGAYSTVSWLEIIVAKIGLVIGTVVGIYFAPRG